MESYKSEPQTIACAIGTVWAKLSNPEVIKQQLDEHKDQLPDEARQNLEKATFSADGITIESPMGPVKLAVADKVEPTHVTFEAQGVPVQINVQVDLKPIDDATTSAVASINADIPLMLRGMVGGKLKEAANKFGQLLSKLPYQSL